MGLFDSLFKKKEPRTYEDTYIVAVVTGPVIKNADIPDPVFAQEMLENPLRYIPRTEGR
ncbi:MAG: PTS glucose transporter subunit IIA [Erysipelotrichaceae bacterium]|nr:PTS glucose transporter subunit IIA [Erysipelotrichaceae bacterium]